MVRYLSCSLTQDTTVVEFSESMTVCYWCVSLQFQVNLRLHFLCSVKNRRKLAEFEELHKHNHELLCNILPEHVTHYFLTTDNQAQVWHDLLTHTSGYSMSKLVECDSLHNCVNDVIEF